jgi:hypothetical protein
MFRNLPTHVAPCSIDVSKGQGLNTNAAVALCYLCIQMQDPATVCTHGKSDSLNTLSASQGQRSLPQLTQATRAACKYRRSTTLPHSASRQKTELQYCCATRGNAGDMPHRSRACLHCQGARCRSMHVAPNKSTVQQDRRRTQSNEEKPCRHCRLAGRDNSETLRCWWSAGHHYLCQPAVPSTPDH